MKHSNRIISIILAAMLLAGMIPGAVFADEMSDQNDPAAETEAVDEHMDIEIGETEPEPQQEIIQKGTDFSWRNMTLRFTNSAVIISEPLGDAMTPQSAAIKAEKTGITVSWAGPKDAQMAPDGYIVLRKTARESVYRQVARLDPSKLKYTDKKAKTRNLAYYYTVVTYVKTGSGIRISPAARWAAGEVTGSKLGNAYTAKLSKTSAKAQISEKISLNITIANASKYFNGKKFRWYSSDKNIASVDSKGNVTALASGTAVITGVMASGREYKCRITIVDAYKPGTVKLETVAATTSSIELEWGKADKATGYDIYCSENGGKDFRLAASTADLKFTHNGLTAKKEYQYYIQARNDNGPYTVLGEKSNVVVQKAVKKNRPFDEPVLASAKLRYGTNDNGVDLTWTISNTNGLDHYEILRGTSNKVSSMKVIGKADAKALSYHYLETTGGNYYYAVRATGKDGTVKTSGASSKLKVTTACILQNRGIGWYGRTNTRVTLYTTPGGKKSAGTVSKGIKVSCIDKYPDKIAKFHDPTWIKVQTPGGKVGWMKYTQLKGGVKARINISKDYTRSVKEDYVNSMGYTSKTGYLTWLCTYTQRVYTFKGSKGKWKLVRTDRTTTGKYSHPTPAIDESHRTSNRGQIYKREQRVYMVTENGRTYYYNNASYFAPGVAYHTGTWWADTGSVRGTVTNKPGTFGCIRMYNEGAAYIYGLPMNTSVIVTNKA